MRVLDQFPELALAAGVVRDDAFGSMAERSLCDQSKPSRQLEAGRYLGPK
jgi:hypothetical protein